MTNQDKPRAIEPVQGKPAGVGPNGPQGGMNQGTGPADQGQPGGHAQQKGTGGDVEGELRGMGPPGTDSDDDADNAGGTTGTRQQSAEHEGMGDDSR